MTEVKIYQLKNLRESAYGFMGFEFAKKHGFNLNDYKLVYKCIRKDDYTEDAAFNEFNMSRPKDFKGHSLSVSDIVQIDSKKWYCDSFGWYEV